MRIGWRTIAALQRFLCERQNALVRKKAGLEGISFKVKKGKFDNLLKEINRDIFQNNPISPDSLESILNIFMQGGTIIPTRGGKDRFMVSEEVYRSSGIKMIKPARLLRRSWVKAEMPACPAGRPAKVSARDGSAFGGKKEGKIKEEVEEGPERKAPKKEKKEEKEEKAPPQPARWVMSEQERIQRPMAIARFEKGILLYYERRYQEAIVEFQKVIDNFNTIIDVTHKAKQYMKFCRDG